MDQFNSLEDVSEFFKRNYGEDIETTKALGQMVLNHAEPYDEACHSLSEQLSIDSKEEPIAKADAESEDGGFHDIRNLILSAANSSLPRPQQDEEDISEVA